MGIIYVNKPKGITSFDVCYKVRKVLQTKHIGHSGTLDPLATGAMILAYDKDTKVIQFLKSDTKEYTATCLIGVETDTLDIDGKVLKKEDNAMPSEDSIKEVLNTFIGKQLQTPPMYSAIRHNGKHLYDLARDNIEVDVKNREIEVFNIELLSTSKNIFTFKCKVSSGTYIRVLLKDILDKLGIIGTLQDLVRTKIGNVDIKDCFSIEDINNGKYIEYSALDVLKDKYYIYEVKDPKSIYNGRPIIDNSLKDEYILVVNDNKAIAIYKKDKEKYTCVRGLF